MNFKNLFFIFCSFVLVASISEARLQDPSMEIDYDVLAQPQPARVEVRSPDQFQYMNAGAVEQPVVRPEARPVREVAAPREGGAYEPAAGPGVSAADTGTQTRPGQSQGQCRQVADETHQYVTEIRQSGALEEAMQAGAGAADQAALQREGAGEALSAGASVQARLTVFEQNLSQLTGTCEQACVGLINDLNREIANFQNQPGAQSYVAQLQQQKQAAESDRESCQTADNQEGNQMRGQLGDLAQMLPMLLAMMQMMQGGPDAQDPGEITDNSCFGMAREKIAAAEGDDPAYTEALETTYNQLCNNDNSAAIADLGSTGGAAPSGSVTASRTGNLPDSRAIDQSFKGGLEKSPQSAKVESFGGGSGGFNGGSGGGGRAASLNGRRGGNPNKLNTDIMKGTSGGGIGGGRRGGGGGYAAGGGRGNRFGRTRNADANKADLKKFLPGGKKYRGPASASAKKGEVSAALGPSNFDKISQRYKKIQNSLLP